MSRRDLQIAFFGWLAGVVTVEVAFQWATHLAQR